jgi:hypothetical protein
LLPPALKPARALATTKEVADYLDVPEATVKSWRRTGYGPPYAPVGKYVRYDWGDVEEWFKKNRVGRGGGASGKKSAA